MDKEHVMPESRFAQGLTVGISIPVQRGPGDFLFGLQGLQVVASLVVNDAVQVVM